MVPSNFMEKLSGEDLLEFHRTAVLAADEDLENEQFTVVPENLPAEEEYELPLTPGFNEVPEVCK